jgi:hypothetical protein
MVRHTGEDFINVEGVTVAAMFPLQSPSVYGSEFDAPQPDGLSRYHDTALSQEILNIAVTQIESIVKPDGVADDIGWESVAFVCIHPPILPIADA